MESGKVMIVDDETDYLATLIKRLKMREVDVTGCQSGWEAMEFIKTHAVDVVVSEVKLADMDGIQILRQIKKHSPLIEVIMLAGYANLEVAIQGMELGAFDFLLKPVEIDELLYKIQDAYKKKALQDLRIKKKAETFGKTQ